MITRSIGARPPVLNAWTHLAGIYDTAANTVQLYVNGVAQEARCRSRSSRGRHRAACRFFVCWWYIVRVALTAENAMCAEWPVPTGPCVVRILFQDHVAGWEVDEFALREGHRYGTTLIGIETRQSIDLLPERTTSTVARRSPWSRSDQPRPLAVPVALAGDVEGGGRFVGDEEQGPTGDRARDEDALGHAARELVRARAEGAFGVGSAVPGRERQEPLADLAARHGRHRAHALDELCAHRGGRGQVGQGFLGT